MTFINKIGIFNVMSTKFIRSPEQIKHEEEEVQETENSKVIKFVINKDINSPLIAQLCELVKRGIPIETAARNLRISPKKVKEWIGKGIKEEENFYALLEQGEHEEFSPSPYYYLHLSVSEALGSMQAKVQEKLHQLAEKGNIKAMEMILKKQGGEVYEEKQTQVNPTQNIEKAVIITTPFQPDDTSSGDWAKKVLSDNQRRKLEKENE